jgi:hypothetical protein
VTRPAEVLVLAADVREAWIRGHVDLAAAQLAVDAVADNELVTGVEHVRGHYGLGANAAGESVTGRLYIDPTRTGPGWFAVTIASLRRCRVE